MDNATMKILVHVLWWPYVYIVLGYIANSDIADKWAMYMFSFGRYNCTISQRGCTNTHIYSSTRNTWVFLLLYLLVKLGIFMFLIVVIVACVFWYHILVSISIYQWLIKWNNFLTWLVVILISCEMSSQDLCSFFY